MKRKVQLFCASAFAALLAMPAFTETTREVVDGQYVITVPEGESCWMTENEEATFHDYPLVKKGKGTLVVGNSANMKNYAGTIYIYEGVYQSQSLNGLGSESATTYVDGGTFMNALMQGGDAAIYPGTIHLKGTGHNDGTIDLGAFRNTRTTPYGAGFANVVLDGDALITITRNGNDSGCETSIRETLDMNGHQLTIRANGTYSEPVLCGLNIKNFANLGNIVVDHAKLSIGAVLMETCTTSLTLTNGGVLDYTNAGEGVRDIYRNWVGNISLILDDGAMIRCNTRTAGFGEWTYHNTYGGPVTINGRTTVTNSSSSNPGSHIQFRTKVSGDGGFDLVDGAKVVFWSTENDFKGDIIVNGVDVTPGTKVNGAESGTPGGEVCGVLGSVCGGKEGSIPTNENQKVVLNKGYIFFNQSVLPEVVCSSEATTVIFAENNCTYSLPRLTGFTTVTNGTGTVTGTWSLRPEDIASTSVLSNLNNTTFSFAEGARLVLTDEENTTLEERKLTTGNIGGLANLKASFVSTSGKFALKVRDNALWLVKREGFLLLVR